MQPSRGTFIGAALIVAAVLIGACSAGSAQEPEPQLGLIPTVNDDSKHLPQPLDAYRYTVDGYQRFSNAANMLARECLARFGVTLPATSTEKDNSIKVDMHNYRRYGLINKGEASTRGYDSPLKDDQGSSRSSSQPATENQFFLMEGRTREKFRDWPLPKDSDGKELPKDGCMGEAMRVLPDGSARPNLAMVDQLSAEAHHSAENDSRVEAVQGRWRECMKRSGYNYSSIWEPNDRQWPNPPGDEEITTAMADVACKVETNLVGIWHATEAAYQQRSINRNAEELARVKAYLDAVYRNSARVLNIGR